jgi:hypothetical protein
MTRISGTLHEDQDTFMIISPSGLLKMKNASANSCKENQNTILCLAFLPKIVPFLSDQVEECGTARQATDENIIPRMRIACWITNAADIYIQICSNYCLSTGKKWLCEHASRLHLHAHCLSCYVLQYSHIKRVGIEEYSSFNSELTPNCKKL